MASRSESPCSANNNSSNVQLFELPKITRSISATSLLSRKSSVKKFTRIFTQKTEPINRIVSKRIKTSVPRDVHSVPTKGTTESVLPHACTIECKLNGSLVQSIEYDDTWHCIVSNDFHVCNETVCEYKSFNTEGKWCCSITETVFGVVSNDFHVCNETMCEYKCFNSDGKWCCSITGTVFEEEKQLDLEQLHKNIDNVSRDCFERQEMLVLQEIDPNKFRDPRFYPDYFKEPCVTLRNIVHYILYEKCSIDKNKYNHQQIEQLTYQVCNTWHWIYWTPMFLTYKESYTMFYHTLVVFFYITKPHDIVYERTGGNLTVLRSDALLTKYLPVEKQLKVLLQKIVTVETSDSTYQSGKSNTTNKWTNNENKRLKYIEQSLESNKLKAARGVFRRIMTEFVRICPSEYLDS